MSDPRLPEAPDPAHPRLVPDRRFPPYRYLPGVGKHPVKHAEGYLRDADRAPPGEQVPSIPASNREWRYGADLFNFAYWWEAHELWEGLWKRVPRDSVYSLTLQGMIQGAAALIKDHQDQPIPASRLAIASVERLKRAHRLAKAQPVMGLDLLDWCNRFIDWRIGRRQARYPFIDPEA